MKSLSLVLSSALLLSLAACSSTSKKKPAPAPAPESSAAPAAQASPSPTGTVTLPSGLQYRVLASGPAGGRSPLYSDRVLVHYRGTLDDGTVFDSSYDRGQPAVFGVGQVIPGWTQALQLMKPGDKWQLHIPSNIAYGSRGAGAKIPPNTDLNFLVELLQIAP